MQHIVVCAILTQLICFKVGKGRPFECVLMKFRAQKFNYTRKSKQQIVVCKH